MKSIAVIFLLISTLTSFTLNAAIKMKPTPLEGLDYNKELLDGNYDSAIPKAETILGFPVGQRTATPEQIVETIKLWEKNSNKIKLVEYARTHENRPLYYALISTPETLAKLDEIQGNLARLGNPKNLSNNEADKIIESLPAVSWMAYSIHGNESSGSDSALAAIYHLIASTDADIKDLLEKSLIIIDPAMNPDGRARFTKGLEQSRGVAPNVDTQSVLHSGFWPYGRTNHYFFDLNRDYILGVHPETIGKVKAINSWYPQLVIDAHEMGALDTYLMGPAREPLNKNLPPLTIKWSQTMADDQAKAFDEHNWPYYTGEWADNLYPGYTTYSEYRGSINILYEQARMAEDGVRQANGRIVSYKESVHHQLVSTLANLKTLAKHSKDIYRDYLQDKRNNISSKGPYANISYVIPANKNNDRLNRFIDLMQLQGFELHTTTKSMTFNNALTQLGNKEKITLPKGSLVIRNRQSEAKLLATMLEFDAKIDNEILIKERQELLQRGSGIMYDTTAWNLTMMYGLEAYTVNSYLNSNLEVYKDSTVETPVVNKSGSIAFMVDGNDDASVAFAARLMEQGVKVRILDKDTSLDGLDFVRGTIVVNRYDNEFYKGDLDAVIKTTATDTAVKAVAISDGFGEGDLPDIGGSHFRLLEQPKIALLTRGNINPYDFGAIWHSIDSHLGIRHSHVSLDTFNFNDLRRYNTLVIPDLMFGSVNKAALEAISSWVDAGGTLIAIDGAIPSLVDPKAKFSSVRELNQTFKDIDKYNLALQREWLATQDSYPEINDIWSHDATTTVNYPWNADDKSPSDKELKKQEQWARLFTPQGAFVAGRTNKRHWLTFGTPDVLPLLISRNPVLMSDNNSEAVVRMGVYEKSPKNKKLSNAGWSTLPDGQNLKLRMSGLLWPEARHRIANSAYLTRERKGNGQIILFASQPAFRGSTKGTNRLLLNALVYGAGLGSNVAINP